MIRTDTIAWSYRWTEGRRGGEMLGAGGQGRGWGEAGRGEAGVAVSL